MILRSRRRAGGTAMAVGAACYAAAVSCSVYDSSLLSGGGSSTGGSGASAGSGTSGMTGEGASGGTAGKPALNAGSSGIQESGGNNGDAGAAGNAADGGEPGETGGASAGTGGKSGGAGGTGDTAGATAGGTAGSGGTAGNPAAGSGGANAGAGGAPPATGCAKLTVPLDDANDTAHFVISLPATADLSAKGGTVAMRVYVAAGTGGTVFNYVQDPTFHFYAMTAAARAAISSLVGWNVITWDVGGQTDSDSIQKTTIKRVGIEVNAATSTSWTNPTVIYVDSIVVTSPTVTYTYNFDASNTVLSAGTTNDQNQTPTVIWFNNGNSDTKATGVTLTWQATCP